MNGTAKLAAAVVVVVIALVIGVRAIAHDDAPPLPARPAADPPSSAPSSPRALTIPSGGDLAPFTAADRLRVRRVDGRARLTAANGRPVLLRGASVNALVDYGRSHSRPVAVRTRDLDQMAVLGFNVMRLAVSWSKVMPAPGQLDEAYLRRVTGLVRRATRRRIHTVISMHADRYAADLGTGTEFDGAPRWAVVTDGLGCGDPRPRYYTPCAAAAARHFYRGDSVAGKSGLAWYADAVAAVAKAGRAGGPGYCGTDILNEPTDPDADPDAAATTAWSSALHGLQRSLVSRLRSEGERAPIWIQPQGPRSVDERTDPVLPTLDDDQLVYAPHAYIDVYDGGPNEATADRLRAQYRAFASEAKILGAATVVGEFPGATGPSWEALRAEHLARQARAGIGGIAWLWKQPRDGYGWGTLAPDGSLRADTNAAQTLAAPRLVAGSRAVRVEPGASGAVTVRSSGAAQTVEVWLGTGFGPDAAGQADYRIRPGASRQAITAQRAWTRTATLGDTPAAGTLIRLRLPQGRASATLEPAG